MVQVDKEVIKEPAVDKVVKEEVADKTIKEPVKEEKVKIQREVIVTDTIVPIKPVITGNLIKQPLQ